MADEQVSLERLLQRGEIAAAEEHMKTALVMGAMGPGSDYDQPVLEVARREKRADLDELVQAAEAIADTPA